MEAEKILLTEVYHPSLIQGLQELGYECCDDPGISQEKVEEIIYEYTGLVVSSRITVDKNLFDAGEKLKFIARAGSGMENIDVDYARSKSVICINSPEGNANAVGEHAVGLLLAFYHHITKSFWELQENKWLVEENRTHELEGRTVGIIGYGNTGNAFAKKLSSFSMNVIAYDKYLHSYGNQYAVESSMDEIFDQCEIISLHVPLTKETAELVNYNFLTRFRNKVFLINTSRGKIVNHTDLLACIQQQKILGAALDVYDNEKFETHTIQEQQQFQSLIKTGSVIFTPHIAGKSFESERKIAAVLLQKISQIL